MRKTRMLALAMGLVFLLAGCAPKGYQAPDMGEIRPIPYRIEVDFSSKIPDDYYMFSGPIETYDRYRVNDRFRANLVGYAQRKGDPAQSRALVLHVTLADFRAIYDSIGAGLPPGPALRLAANTARGGIFRLGSDFDSGGEPGHLPLEIIKTVRLTVQVQIAVPSRQARVVTIGVEKSTRIEHQYYDSWTYDYSRIIGEALTEALARIDGLVDEMVEN